MTDITFAITLPTNGSPADYQRALVEALCKTERNHDPLKASAIGGVIGTILAPSTEWPWNRKPT